MVPAGCVCGFELPANAAASNLHVARAVLSVWHVTPRQRTMQGILGLNFQFGIMCCIPTASSREPSPCAR